MTEWVYQKDAAHVSLCPGVDTTTSALVTRQPPSHLWSPRPGGGGGLLQENHNHALPTGLTLLGILDVTQCDPLVC